ERQGGCHYWYAISTRPMHSRNTFEERDPKTTDPKTTDPKTTDSETTDSETTDTETTDSETTDSETTDAEAMERVRACCLSVSWSVASECVCQRAHLPANGYWRGAAFQAG